MLKLNVRTDNCGNAIYVGRGTPWGNPYKIGWDGDREAVIHRFETYTRDRLLVDPDWLLPLVGEDLSCHCSPLPCHIDVIIKLIGEIYGSEAVSMRQSRVSDTLSE